MSEPDTDSCPDACSGFGNSHQFETISVEIAGYGSASTYAVEQCNWCDGVRLNFDVDFLGKHDTR